MTASSSRAAYSWPRTRALSRVRPCSASTYGVGTPTIVPISRTAPVSASSSRARPASASCSIEVRKSPSLRVTSLRSAGVWSIGQPIRAPISRVSSMADSQNARTRSSSRTWPAVAPVSADTGFTVRLPHSLYQTSSRMRGETVMSSPASVSKAASRRSRGESLPSGSPMMMPFPAYRRITPGSGEPALMCTVPPITRATGMTSASWPPGSTLSRWHPAQGPPKPSKNHHGTPLRVDSTAVSGPSNGPMLLAAAGADCAFTAMITTSCVPSSAASSLAVTAAVTVPAADSTRRPRDRIAASVAPRASTEVAVAAVAAAAAGPAAVPRAVAMTPPMAPAPTTQMRMGATLTVVGPRPDVAVVHQPYLLVDHLAAVVGVVVGDAVEVEVLRVDRLIVDHLVLLGGQVLEPVVPLRRRAEPAQRLHIDGAGHPGRLAAVVMAADDLPTVVDDRRSAAERVDRDVGLPVQVVGADVARDQVQVIIEGTRPVLNLEQAVADVRVRVRSAVDHLRAVHGKSAGVLRVRALVGLQEAEPPDLRVGHRVERVQVAPVQFDPLVPHVVRGHRVLDGQQRHDLVVLEDEVALGVEDEADVEEPPGEFGVAGLRLGHQERVPLPGQLAEVLRLGAGHVDRTVSRELLMVEVEDLVVEALQGAFRYGDEANRQVQAGQPGCRLDQVRNVLQVAGDFVPVTDDAHGGYQADGLIGLDHDLSLRRYSFCLPDGLPDVCSRLCAKVGGMIMPLLAGNQ